MSGKVCKTAARKRISFGIILGIFCTVLLVAFGIFYYTMCYDRVYEAPSHEQLAIQGSPIPPDENEYSELEINETYHIRMCAKPKYQEGEVYLYLMNPNSNEVWFQVEISQDQKVLATSGLIYQGEYLEKIACKLKDDEDNIQIKIIGYTPEAYHSEGNVNLSVDVMRK